MSAPKVAFVVHTTDHPEGKFVANMVENGVSTDNNLRSDDIWRIRAVIASTFKHMRCYPRREIDDPVIVESWF